MMFSNASSIGTKPTNNKKVVYGVGGQAIQSNKPENMANKTFFFIKVFVHEPLLAMTLF